MGREVREKMQIIIAKKRIIMLLKIYSLWSQNTIIFKEKRLFSVYNVKFLHTYKKIEEIIYHSVPTIARMINDDK